MKYFLDTNVLIAYLKDHTICGYINEHFNPFGALSIPIISVITIGEIESIATRNKWGQRKRDAIQKLIDSCVITDINSKDVLTKYGEIDAYSQGKLNNKVLNISARNMGKNDIWIAASATVSDSILLTMDKDFEHLNEQFLQVKTIQIIRL